MGQCWGESSVDMPLCLPDVTPDLIPTTDTGSVMQSPSGFRVASSLYNNICLHRRDHNYTPWPTDYFSSLSGSMKLQPRWAEALMICDRGDKLEPDRLCLHGWWAKRVFTFFFHCVWGGSQKKTISSISALHEITMFASVKNNVVIHSFLFLYVYSICFPQISVAGTETMWPAKHQKYLFQDTLQKNLANS